MYKYILTLVLLLCLVISGLESYAQFFKTGTYIDPRDGKSYGTVEVDQLIWMTENFAYLHPETIRPVVFGSYKNPISYVYGFEGEGAQQARYSPNYQHCGVLYNWSAAIRSIPKGWRLPTYAEWQIFLNMIEKDNLDVEKREIRKSMSPYERSTLPDPEIWVNAAKYCKSKDFWKNPGNNEYVINIVPSGIRNSESQFIGISSITMFWTDSEGSGYDNEINPLAYAILFTDRNHEVVGLEFDKNVGMSIRLVRDLKN